MINRIQRFRAWLKEIPSGQTPGLPRIKRPGSPVLFFICMATILTIGWTIDYKSCLRTETTRTGLVTFFMGQRDRANARKLFDPPPLRILDGKAALSANRAAQAEKPLICLSILPPT